MVFYNTISQLWKYMTKEEENYLDTYSLLESLNWIWRGFGILIVVPKSPSGNKKYVNNKFLIAYNCLLLFVYLSSLFGSAYNPSRNKIIQSIGVDVQVLIYVRQKLNFICMFDLIFWKTIVNNRFKETIDLLVTQDKILIKLDCQYNYKSYLTKNVIIIRSYVAILVFMSCHEFISGFKIFDWITWWFPMIIHKLNICLFLNLVCLIGIRFGIINKKLKFIAQSSASQIFLDSDENLAILRTIGNMHADLCKIGKRFNYIFMISLITSALEAFVFMTLALYSFITALQNKKNFLELLPPALLIISCSFPIIVIVIICNWTKKQACSAEWLIHEIKLQEDSNILSDMIQIFSLQMQHQKLSFSVGGFFILDPALLQAITAAITTNLIILIQFGHLESILLNKNQ